MNKYEVGTRPEEVQATVCEQCRMMVWSIEVDGNEVLVQPKEVMIVSKEGEMVEGYVPHIFECEPLEE